MNVKGKKVLSANTDLEEAKRQIGHMQADLGGTEIATPL
jgi:hypothetical protein